MIRFRLFFIAFLALLAGVSFAKDAEDPASLEVIKGKELSKSGNFYILPADKEVVDGMKTVRQLKKKVEDDTKVRNGLEAQVKRAKGYISTVDLERRKLFEQLTKTQDATQHNQIIAKINIYDSKIAEAGQAKEVIEQKLNGISAEPRQQFINNVIDLSTKVEEAQDKYKELAEESEVKDAIEKINETARPKMRLGPSAEFTTAANQLKKWRGDVSSDTIPLQSENHVNTVEVTLNGTVTRGMVLDSGAGLVCVTADLAEQLKMVPGENDRTIQLTLADGKSVEGKLMVLKSVRVGQFTVEDVECAVLPKSLVAAEPLLGGTFLRNFIYRIDPKAGELHLAVIAGSANNVKTAGGKGDKKDAKKPGDKPDKTAKAEKKTEKQGLSEEQEEMKKKDKDAKGDDEKDSK